MTRTVKFSKITLFFIALAFCWSEPKGVSIANEVVGNNEMAAYIGTGGLLLPGSFSGNQETKSQVANCIGCTWAYTVYCMYDSEGLCKHSVSTCSAGQIRYRVWFGSSRQSMMVIGSVCWGSGMPPTRQALENHISDLVVTYVPKLEVSISPPDGSITAIPVLAWVNQERLFAPPTFSLAGRNVSIQAIANWRWVWGDGNVQWLSIPGAPYPSKQISHHYRIEGDYLLTVTTVWQANYTVEGIGTFSTAGELVTQNDSINIPILRARSVLMKSG